VNKTLRDVLIGQITAGLQLGAGSRVVWAQRPALGQPAAKAPARPYATVLIVSERQIHQSAFMPRVGDTPSAADDLKQYLTIYDAEIQVSVLTDLDHDAVEAVARLQRYLKTWAARVALKAQKIAYTGPLGAARDASSFGDAAWEGRADVDLGLRWTVEWSVDEGVIEAASFELDLEGFPVEVDVDTTP
jgi:hypothetical protein